ncbi:hydroxypyruvate isomerase family protein [Nioella aestuarii]|uniref:hydroxypyruvate isomerase family protein n=1 Tax=Nioella aestuarii TaxID=1662864 RepID=UPI003D7FEED8
MLWADRDLPDAIRAAAKAGFEAVECHWPYDSLPRAVADALHETGLPMLGLNTAPGDLAAGEFGLAAVPGREPEAREAIDQAIAYAAAVGARNVHVMAGKAEGAAAEASFRSNLRYACDHADAAGITVLIEPLNSFDVPGYFLTTTDQAAALIGALKLPALRLMFDCYHVGRQEGDVAARMQKLLPIIGHIQFASVPDRGPPDEGELNYRALFSRIRMLGYDAPLGAEYRPRGATEDSLDWLAKFRG